MSLAPEGAPLGHVFAFFANESLGRNDLSRTNTLAYFCARDNGGEKSFITLTLGMHKNVS